MTQDVTAPRASQEPALVPSTETLHQAYAEASILLVESLLLVLLQRNVLSRTDIEEAIEVAVETKKNFVDDNVHPAISRVAAGVLRRIGNSVASQHTAPIVGARRTD